MRLAAGACIEISIRLKKYYIRLQAKRETHQVEKLVQKGLSSD